MTEPTKNLPRATSYAWRLSLLIPAAVMLAVGLWVWTHAPPGGEVMAIRLTTKGDIAGQTREAYDSVDPGTPDLYLVIQRQGGQGEIRLPPYNDTPIGNGLTFTLPRPTELTTLTQVAVWDANGLLPDKQLDRIELPGGSWTADGQTFHIDLNGTHNRPADWALPLAAVGATLAAVVLLRFVWDQAM